MGQNNVFHNVFRDVCRGIACCGTSCQKIATQVRFDDFKSELPHAKLNVRPLSPKHNVEDGARAPEKENLRRDFDQLCVGGKGREARTLVSHGGDQHAEEERARFATKMSFTMV